MDQNFKKITTDIIEAAKEVYSTLGYGFVREVYEEALQIELRQMGYQAERDFPLEILYKGVAVGKFTVNLLVEKNIIIDLKIASEFTFRDEEQLFHQLRAVQKDVGLLINFGRKKVEHKQILGSNLVSKLI